MSLIYYMLCDPHFGFCVFCCAQKKQDPTRPRGITTVIFQLQNLSKVFVIMMMKMQYLIDMLLEQTKSKET